MLLVPLEEGAPGVVPHMPLAVDPCHTLVEDAHTLAVGRSQEGVHTLETQEVEGQGGELQVAERQGVGLPMGEGPQVEGPLVEEPPMVGVRRRHHHHRRHSAPKEEQGHLLPQAWAVDWSLPARP